MPTLPLIPSILHLFSSACSEQIIKKSQLYNGFFTYKPYNWRNLCTEIKHKNNSKFRSGASFLERFFLKKKRIQT